MEYGIATVYHTVFVIKLLLIAVIRDTVSVRYYG